MEERRSRSTASAKPARVRVLSPWALLGVTVAVIVTFYLLFPRQTLTEKLQAGSGSGENDQLAADYISALLRTEPANFELRMLLAEKRHAMGQPALAREAMEPVALAPDPALRRRALLLEARILESEVAAARQSGGDSAAAEGRLREHLSRHLEEDWTPRQLLDFSLLARAMRLPDLASAYARRLERSGAGVPSQWLAEAAQQALGDGAYAESARLYFSAQERAAERGHKRGYFLKGLAALRSGNLLHEALRAADAHLGELRDDEETLTYLTRLALAAGDPKRAQVYVKRLMHLSLSPSSTTSVLASIDSPPLAARAARCGGQPFDERAACRPKRSSHPSAPLPAGEGRKPQSPSLPSPAGRGVGGEGMPFAGFTAAAMLKHVMGWLVASAHAAEAAPPTAMRPYDEQLYTLAYDVFLANGNAADAWRVAAAAVAQRPQDMAWRRKLAQSAEWSGRPQEALQHWLMLGRRTGAEDAWQAVLRLAPGLQDDEALLAAWVHETQRRPLTPAEWRIVAGLYESLGRPADGIAFLDGQYRRHHDIEILEVITDLQERSGRVDEAIASLERMRRLGHGSPAHALRQATLLFLRSDFARAYAVLQAQQAGAKDEDSAYWKLLADLAWQLQDDATAERAYGRLQAAGRAQADDLERLVQLLRPQHPEDARRMALFAWQKFRSLAGFMLALELSDEQRDYAAMKALIEGVRPDEDAKLSANGYYFMLRAAYYQAVGDRPRAMAEYRRAMASAPDNVELRLSYLWLLVDAREATELRRRLTEWGGSDQPAWWDAYAAGWLALGEPRRALPFMSRQADAHAGDYLWLANYAETLEEAGHTGMAARVRRHAWLQARKRMRDQPELARQREPMLAYARLALRNAPGDASLDVMRRLLRQDTPAAAADAPPPEQAMDRAVAELVLAWTLGEERLAAAREFMWRRFARRVQAPAWADIGLALAERDHARLADILDETPDGNGRDYPAAARIDAARELGRTALAQALGFAAQERQPDSDDIHLRLATDLLATATSVIARDVSFRRGAVQGHEESLRVQTWPLDRLRLALDLGITHQHSADGDQLTGVPGADRTLALSALWRHDGDRNGRPESELTVAARSGLASFHTLKLAHTRPLGERLSGVFALAWRDRATESVALGIGGHKDEASATLNYRLSGREYLSGRLWQAAFHTQQDARLGEGRGLSLEAGYRVRSEYPDFNVRVSRQISRFEAAGGVIADASAGLLPGSPATAPAAFFMPQSFRLWGINAGFGTELREQRSRAIRPFADIGRTVSSTSGSGYNWLVGAGGSVLGPDHLSLYWLRSKGGGIGAAVRELGLRYQLYLD